MKVKPAPLGLFLVFISTSSVYAALNTKTERGASMVQIAVAGRGNEICVLPKHLDGGDYKKKDTKSEQELCGYDFYKNVAICPKLNSTNPGLNFFEIPAGDTAEKFEAAQCKTPKSKMEAKYKLSTSCSYTPSILGYYHMSRILGDIANVPPAVIRTVDLHEHIALGQKALSEVQAGSVISQTWNGLMAVLRAGANSPRRDLILTDDFQQSYGALSENPRHEVFYKEFFNGGANNVSRTQNFGACPIMASVASNSAIAAIVPHQFTAANAQKMQAMKDAADMVIIDSIMSQQDRMGNIHELTKYVYFDENGKLQSERKLDPADVTKYHAFQVKEMMLKDNDCGVDKDNISMQVGLISRVHHVSPETYKRLIKLDSEADQASTKAFFETELLFTNADYTKFRANLKTVATKLHDGCKAGTVKLDLDLEGYFGKGLQAEACD